LKKINKTQGQDKLTPYALVNQMNSWKSFKGNKPDDARADKNLMLQDQEGLCAYCEANIGDLDPYQQSVEHFHDKSDDSNLLNHNWGLDWQNVFAVCKGGETEGATYPTPDNLSCDRHKEYRKDIPAACEGYLLNPLDIIASPALFEFNKATLHLKPNLVACQSFTPIHNHHSTVEELVQNTIDILNLNCQRLIDSRQQVLNAYNKEIEKMRLVNNQNGPAQLAQHWFGNKWPSFFTTRRSLLGQHAEDYLQIIQYNG
jgi:uncharacterized protein (TIGR02646 family)